MSRHGDEQADVFSMRIERLRKIGFDLAQALELAETEADIHQAEQIIQDGCSIETAYEILR